MLRRDDFESVSCESAVFASISAEFESYAVEIGLVDWFKVRSDSAAFEAKAAEFDGNSAQFATNTAGFDSKSVAYAASTTVSGVVAEKRSAGGFVRRCIAFLLSSNEIAPPVGEAFSFLLSILRIPSPANKTAKFVLGFWLGSLVE
jgi:hypothetical protein